MAGIRLLAKWSSALVFKEKERAGPLPTFRDELNDQCGRILIFASLVTMVAWLPYIPLDRRLHPEEPLIVLFRVGLSVVSLVVFVLHISGRFARHHHLLLSLLGGYLAVSCGLITALAKADPVYVGGNLFILTLLAAVPVSRRAALSVLAGSLAVFFLAGYFQGISFSSASASYSLHDVLSVAAVAVLFICLLDKSRRTSWLKSKEIERQGREMKSDKEKIDALLLNILPGPVARELKERGAVRPVFYSSATIVFTDFVRFTEISEKLSPEELVRELDDLFCRFDRIMDRFGLEKLKTIGDAYMFAGGVPVANGTHAVDAVLGALEIRQLVDQANREKEGTGRPVFEIRIGVHTGPLMAGVVGEKKFVYDVWGDSVNLASRMESSGEKGRINVSEATYVLIRELFETEARGQVTAKYKGEQKMYFVRRIREEFSSDACGLTPNGHFQRRYRKLRDCPGEA
jgi:class 3 adenylate cyclase